MYQRNTIKKSQNQQRFNWFRKAKETNLAPVKTLILSAIIGTLAGLIGVLFEKSVGWVIHLRQDKLAEALTNPYLLAIGTLLVSSLLAMSGYYLVKKFSPESGGSGIPEIEGAMIDIRPVRWWRVLPVKFIASIGTLGSGMVLGREGPTVQLGANIGQLVNDVSRVKDKGTRQTLLATGAAAGLTAAFNAPLAGILFIIEEMRPQFKYNLISIKSVFIGVIMSCIVFRLINGEGGVIQIGKFSSAPMNTLWLYLVLGMLFGVVGVIFSKLLFYVQTQFQHFYQDKTSRFVLAGGVIGGACGLLALIIPEITGGGFSIIPALSAGGYSLTALLLFFVLRTITTIISFSSGAPGGIFAPTLALGTLFGSAFGLMATYLFPDYQIQIGTFAIAGMGALFAATVRAPLTGIVLVLEMTDNYQLILPMIITCLGATMLAQLLGGRPIYTVLLERILQRSEAKEKTEAPKEPL
ncbi:H(+)/Cl(-) exchange transporter ClcA [Proteus mirabilis]|uniref:H(+)/Cl(-) exchange transporter ClcA n=1 Tax=Proteus mirabilis TaxID=584 RepID=UPI0018C47B95|nr:H(+)/Cl(-) exchange transporter ClcA [Proteus mirabilis]MBG6040368.1 H(+)/Cl(-) exchange transporter ClcA [Proteus mirabilis]MCY9777154.1 H(+)/Cl(-) exchange transporter ClcA [Proteus mirabilis]MCY9781962.1 H(+)/Cl(-) exchange transporter ClcA [Proteus mirabilis]MCY9789528.1 H(+)/Cl(-) exchange transporter ClcA [Proteus mirabilis]